MPSYSDPTAPAVSAITPTSSAPGAAALICLLSGIVALGFAGFLFWQITQVKAASSTAAQETADKQQQLKQFDATLVELKNYDSLSLGLTNLFEGQKVWESVLDNVSQHLYKHIAITSLQIDSTGKVTMSGTTPTYTDYAKLYTSLTDATAQQYFSEVKPTAVSKQAATDKDPTSSVSFSFTFTVLPQLLTSTAS